ncbi:tyrosine-type recombinase/integrase, partial [Burkholderia sp. BCC1970]|uniref:tyrosine-type recombinase/integrase n=1 Tax=Burkholderia sp. BCC1970 TaxID=2817437 RepID=UPI002ABD1EDF
FYLQRGAIGSKKSWEPIGRALYDYFGFLEAHKLDWYDVSRGEHKNLVAAYRDYCFEATHLSRNTVRHRLTYICAFYEYAVRRMWIAKLPYSFEHRRIRNANGFLAHLDASGGSKSVAEVMPRKHQKLVRYLTVAESINLMKAADNVHHHAIIKMALKTGLRREELASFPASYVFNPDARGILTRNVRVLIDPADGSCMKTKGSKERTIYMTRDLMKFLHHYVTHYRGERASLTGERHPHLFLNQEGLPFSQDGKGIEAMVRSVGRKIGLRTHPHMLRHTYATHTLVALQSRRRKQRIEPLVFLQKQLGHTWLSSVMVYLHIVNEHADEAVLTYDEELDDWGGCES